MSASALHSSIALTPLPKLLQVGGLTLPSHCCQQQSTCSHHRRLPVGWNLEKPHFGRANVDKLSAKELKALEKTLSGHAPAETGSVAAEVSGIGSGVMKVLEKTLSRHAPVLPGPAAAEVSGFGSGILKFLGRALSGHAPAEPGSVAAEVSGRGGGDRRARCRVVSGRHRGVFPAIPLSLLPWWPSF